MRPFLILLLLVVWAPSTAIAWHDKGHRATASIAFDELSEDSRDTIRRILMAHPRFAEDFAAHLPDALNDEPDDARLRWYFEHAATWPDLIQGLDESIRHTYHYGRWHYINIPVYLKPEDEAALAGSLDHNVETQFAPPLRQNLNIIQALRGNLQVWQSDTSSDAEKGIALCWILHLVGDLHQPLHTVALFSKAYFPKGDRGGNSIDVAWRGENRNLHSVWDSRPSNIESYVATTSTLWRLHNERVDDHSIDRWLIRHSRLARRFVYTDEVRTQLLLGLASDEFPAIELSSGYLADAQALAHQQVIMAGKRIAKLLVK